MIEVYLENSDEQLLLANLEKVGEHELAGKFYLCVISLDKTNFFSQRRDVFEWFSSSVAKFVFDNQGKCFRLHNFDLCILLRLESVRTFERAKLRLTALLGGMSRDLGLSRSAIESGTDWYKCDTDFDVALGRAIRASSVLNDFLARRSRLMKRATKINHAGNELGMFDADMLFDLEQKLQRANIDTFLRTQPICLLRPGSLPDPIFWEVYVSTEQLRKQFAPNVDLLSTPALFHQLARSIDKRVLRAIGGGFVGAGLGSFSLNLTLSTILSQTFRDFDARAGQSSGKNQMIVEIQPYDVLWDFTEFKVGCEFLRANGYRVLLDGVTPRLLKTFLAMGIKPDFVKMIIEQSELEDWKKPEYVKLIRENASLIINARCSSNLEGSVAAAAGIELFQGWVVDEALRGRFAPRFVDFITEVS